MPRRKKTVQGEEDAELIAPEPPHSTESAFASSQPRHPKEPRLPQSPRSVRLPRLPRAPRQPTVLASLASSQFEPQYSTPVLSAASATGQDLIGKAQQHIGERYVLGARAPMSNSNWSGPWDCAEYCSWCVYQASGILYGVSPNDDPMRADAYTGFWARDAEAMGTIVSIEEAVQIVGACLLRKPRSSRVGHIVFSDGQGGTFEAHSANTGVTQRPALGRRWDYGVLVPGIRYFRNENPIPLEPEPGVLRLTDPMTRGQRVLDLQRSLASLGYGVGEVDGIYGPQTESAVMDFQADAGIVVDGEYGSETAEALAEALNK